MCVKTRRSSVAPTDETTRMTNGDPAADGSMTDSTSYVQLYTSADGHRTSTRLLFYEAKINREPVS